MNRLIFYFFLFCHFISVSDAFVENTVKGYPNCMACHHSPTGGGILTEYGRSISAEMMSTWKLGKASHQPFFGLVKNQERVHLGGHIRTMQIRSETPNSKVGRLFLMQRNIEALVKFDKVSLVGTVGTLEGPEGTPEKGDFLSERHFLLWETSDFSRMRIGKFRQAYGLNDPNHTRLNKQSLGFGSQSETYGMEFIHLYDWGEIIASTAIGKLASEKVRLEEKSFSGQLTYYHQGQARSTINILHGQDDQEGERTLVGVNGIFPIIGKDLFSSYQLDLSLIKDLRNPDEDSLKGVYGFWNIAYDITKGLMGYLLVEYARPDFETLSSQVVSPGLGVRWLPLAHFEFQLEHQFRQLYVRQGTEQRTWVLFHLYL